MVQSFVVEMEKSPICDTPSGNFYNEIQIKIFCTDSKENNTNLIWFSIQRVGIMMTDDCVESFE